jgi:hypothetical protein
VTSPVLVSVPRSVPCRPLPPTPGPALPGTTRPKRIIVPPLLLFNSQPITNTREGDGDLTGFRRNACVLALDLAQAVGAYSVPQRRDYEAWELLAIADNSWQSAGLWRTRGVQPGESQGFPIRRASLKPAGRI